MQKINFIKMVAAGNDFVVINKTIDRISHLARMICNRKYGIGADGLLVLEKSKIADIRMRIFNSDGSEAEMCGNGARCTALYLGKRTARIETKAGIINAEVNDSNVNPVRNTKALREKNKISNGVKIKLTDPTDIKLDISIKINNRDLVVNFINTGVPHTVVFAEGLDKIDAFNLGREIRYNKKFAPAGTNVDFVEALSNDSIAVRTYERGVEEETFACGTGVVAAALIADYKLRPADFKEIKVKTRSGEVLRVYFERAGSGFKNIWLEGRAKIVYKGEYYV